MRIYDGRPSFYQWDTNQKITSDQFKVGDEIHFFNMKQPNALVVLAYELDNKIVVDVPNILLQKSYPIIAYRVYVDDDGKATIEEHQFEVNQRPKPEDYVYTETEILNYETLANEIKEVKENLGASIQDYLKENPISVDLSDYAKKEDIPSTDGLATEEYVNNKVQGLASTDYVDQAIAAVPQPDLSNYVTNEELQDNAENFEKFIMFRVQQKGYQTAEEVNSKISDALNAIGVAEGRTY